MSAPENPPAFPRTESRNSEGPVCLQDSTARIVSVGGITLRDYFAGQALVGILSNATWTDALVKHNGTDKDRLLEDIGGQCYDIADAMLAERSK